MKEKEIEKALIKIANKEGVAPEFIRHEIIRAIDEAKKIPNDQIQALWQAIPCKGEHPTPEELILHIYQSI